MALTVAEVQVTHTVGESVRLAVNSRAGKLVGVSEATIIMVKYLEDGVDTVVGRRKRHRLRHAPEIHSSDVQ